MPRTVTCPNCSSLLHSKKAIPAGTGLRCPGCRTSFTAPDVAPMELPLTLADETPERPSSFGAPFVIATAVALILGVSVVTATAIYALRPTPQPVALKQEEPPTESAENALAKEREAQAAAAAKREEQKKKDDFARLLTKADVALNKGDFAEAEKLYTQALDANPTDAEARKGLISAVSSLKTQQTAQQNDDKRKKDVEKLLAEGEQALGKKEYLVAVRTLESAISLDPAHEKAKAALSKARDELDKDKTEKVRLADYQTRFDAGKVALKADRYADAVKEFQAALRVMPDDLEAAGLLKQAENKLINLADKDKKQAAFTNLLDRARTAQNATRFKEAEQTAEAALRLMPNDRDAERAVRDARTAMKKAKAENDTRLAQADEAAKLGRVDSARQLLQDATKAWADDARAERQLRELDRLANNVQAAQAVNNAAYQRAIQAAEAAYAAQNWALAVSSYNNALRLNNLDADGLIARQLTFARDELKREEARRVDYDQAIRRARAAMNRRAYGDAVTALRTALRFAPPETTAAVKLELIEARYQKNMADGRLAVQARRYRDALAAFDAALNEKPEDRDALINKRTAEQLVRGTTTTEKPKAKDAKTKAK